LEVIRPFAVPLLLPPKIGWRVAKFGVKMAQKPIAPVKEMIFNGVKMVFGSPEKIVTEITAADLKRMMIAATKKIVSHQEEINRINVFPVADKDTGYNLAATLLGIEGTISKRQELQTCRKTTFTGNAATEQAGLYIEFLQSW